MIIVSMLNRCLTRYYTAKDRKICCDTENKGFAYEYMEIANIDWW